MLFSRLAPAVLIAAVPSVMVAQQAARDSASVTVIARLLVSGVDVKPVPLHPLLVLRVASPAADTTPVTEVRTDFDGRGAVRLAAGAYRLRSKEPVTIGGTAYRWDVAVTVTGGAAATVELNNLNADTTRAVAFVFDLARRAVLPLSTGLRHGSAFVTDCALGLLVTNDHVIGGAKMLSVQLDSTRRVAVQVLHRDEAADLAVVRVHPETLTDCVALPLARRGPDQPIAAMGDQVMALGYPLRHHEPTLTTGIVSGVRPGAVISDVTISPGSSGGPLLNQRGEVIAVATFVRSGGTGGAMAGAVSVDKLAPLVDSAAAKAAVEPPPEARALPQPPAAEYPLALVKALGDTVASDGYKRLTDLDAGQFHVVVATPVSTYVRWRDHQRQVAKDRKKRAAAAGVEDDVTTSSYAPVRDWMRLTDNLTTAAVSLGIDPKSGQTSGSALRTMMVGGQRTVRFKGDLARVELLRDGAVVEPVGGGMEPLVMDFDAPGARMTDIANHAHLLFPPDVFAPDASGAPPTLILRVEDLKNPGDRSLFELPPEVTARVWNDFEPYYRAVHPDRPFVRAERARYRSRFQELCLALGGKC